MDQIRTLIGKRQKLAEKLNHVDTQLWNDFEGEPVQVTYSRATPLHKVYYFDDQVTQEHKKLTYIRRDSTGKAISYHFYSRRMNGMERGMEEREKVIEPVQFRFTHADGNSITARPDQIEKLLGPYMQQSEFGDTANKKTATNLEVRNSFSLRNFELVPGHHITHVRDADGTPQPMKVTPGSSYWRKICQKVGDEMLNGRQAEFIPHALNMYHKGGHFETHVDTPRHSHSRMVGTLVMFLQGKPYLEVNGDKIRFEPHGHNLCVVFFYGDVPHRVLPNPEKQVRISATFDVVLKEDLPLLTRKLSNPIRQILLTHPNKTVAFVLKNRYTLAALEEKIMKCPEDQRLLEELEPLGAKAQSLLILANQARHFAVESRLCESLKLDFNDPFYERDEDGSLYSPYLTTEHLTSKDSLMVHKLNLPEDGRSVVIVDPFRNPEEHYRKQRDNYEDDDGLVFSGNQWDDGVSMICDRIYTSAVLMVRT